MSTRFIRPRAGLIVRDPGLAAQNAPLPPEGKAVPWNSYWQRRLDDGDVEIVEAPARANAKGDAK